MINKNTTEKTQRKVIDYLKNSNKFSTINMVSKETKLSWAQVKSSADYLYYLGIIDKIESNSTILIKINENFQNEQ